MRRVLVNVLCSSKRRTNPFWGTVVYDFQRLTDNLA